MLYWYLLAFAIVAIIVSIALVCRHNVLMRKQVQAEIKRKQIENDPNYQQLVVDMKVLVTLITSSPERYLNITKRQEIKICGDDAIKNAERFGIQKDYYGYAEYYVLKMAQVDILTKLNRLNESFIKSAIDNNKELFDNIDGKSLDQQQRTAIVIDELHNLIVAGAGSGKTLTILGKVLYLLKNGVSPQEILLIAFTKKSAGELSERVNRNLPIAIDVATFHKLGLDIITRNSNERPDIDDKMDSYIEDYFSKELIKHNEQIQVFLEFIGYYFNVPMELKADGTLGEKIESEQSIDLEPLDEKYKKLVEGEKKTIKGERVKSIEELIIANFLFLNGVKYEYEQSYPFETDKTKKRYRPDFYLVDYYIYLEHFGVDKNNRCPWLSEIEEQKYITGIEWKRGLHAENNTKLIETYSYFQNEGRLLEELREILLSNGVTLEPISNDNMLKLVNEIQSENTIREFVKLCCTFIKLFKSNGYDETHFAELKNQLTISLSSRDYINQFLSTRTLHFLNIVERVFLYYKLRLDKNNAIDFSDMINIATKQVQERGIDTKYKHIIIDEYQDIGMDRYKLIKAIIEKTAAHLMCVGDDWQSIYRFAGSDASLFMSFSRYWGETQISKIENTYRNSQELINIASAFVMKNPKQIPKMLRSQKSCSNPVWLHFYNDNNFFVVLDRLLKRIIKEYGESASVLMLGRTNHDIELLRLNKNHSNGNFNSGIEPFTIRGSNVISKKYDKLKIEFLTVHKSKGLEAENVIILNMKNDRLGFPNQIADDPILQTLLPSEDNFSFAEERRLFYVALTRTKNKTHILVPDKNASGFAKEIKSLCCLEIPDGENLIVNNPNCPKCKTGRLLVRQASDNSKKYFVGCSNFPACDFTNNDTSIVERPIRCSSCGGFLVVRKGTAGQFLGCTNYPDCRKTAKINSDNLNSL